MQSRNALFQNQFGLSPEGREERNLYGHSREVPYERREFIGSFPRETLSTAQYPTLLSKLLNVQWQTLDKLKSHTSFVRSVTIGIYNSLGSGETPYTTSILFVETT